jgi:uncharacterized repeat protein (TIGR04138 family)
MALQTQKTVLDIARELRRYSPEALEFVREGLDYTVQRRHGPVVKTIRKLFEWLEEQDADLCDLPGLVEQGQAPPAILDFIREAGGVDDAVKRLNLHIDGQDLCWGLRDFAIERWGLMAASVLRSWGVASTMDFGRIVFALVDGGLLQKQDHDCIDDFRDVYDFDSALDGSFDIPLDPEPEEGRQAC